ncbi:AzlD domain-containing protein [Nocardia sp. CDC159]|uniref:AzlD domain-containing protein n=1 Tax=Nocardia pulmonis TaxID=2951408 RepID=A0A9X2EC96_9NOCA|nr:MULTISPECIES: AzlD domain-containing protein [Nocardia]MCM6777680.1 AzlD domain-containing protein [Nocardia pulmonis]MCM6790516.1 AzlD domain-containing protein [Nocardia sp. CDC159]
MSTTLIAGAIALAVGTYAIRFAGPLLRRRINVPPHVTDLLETGSVVLLTALAVTELMPSGHKVGFALPAGALVAVVLAWRRAPLIVVALTAAATTALLRVLGVA